MEQNLWGSSGWQLKSHTLLYATHFCTASATLITVRISTFSVAPDHFAFKSPPPLGCDSSLAGEEICYCHSPVSLFAGFNVCCKEWQGQRLNCNHSCCTHISISRSTHAGWLNYTYCCYHWLCTWLWHTTGEKVPFQRTHFPPSLPLKLDWRENYTNLIPI